MKFQILTLFPEFFDSCFKTGLLSRAIENSLLNIELIDIKNFTDKGRADDYPFGGGDGMLLRYDILKKALQSLPSSGRVICLSAQGEKWSFKKAKDYSQKYKQLTLICGRYAGVDSRFVKEFVDEEVSIGDYILNGGESASLVLIESLSRFLDGFLGNKESSKKESFEESLLEGPSWTKPRNIEGHSIPEVIFSGHHEKIKELRFYTSLLLTHLKRPDLLEGKTELLSQLPSAKKALETLSIEELSTLGFSKQGKQLLLYKKLKT